MNISDIKNEDLKYMVERIEPYFASSIIIRGMVNSDNVKNVLGWNAGVRWLYTNNYFFVKTSDQDVAKIELANRFRKDGSTYANTLIEKCFEFGDRLISTAKSIETLSENENLSPSEMRNLLNTYLIAASNYMIFQNIVLFEDSISELAHKIANKYGRNESEKAKILQLISTANRLTGGEKEQDDLLRLCIRVATKDEEQDHARKYGWLAIRFFVGEPWTLSDVHERLLKMDQTTAEHELEKRIAHRERIEEELGILTGNFAPEDRDAVRLIRDIVYLRTQRTDFFQESSYYVQPLVRKIAAHLKVSYEDLLYLSASEVITVLNKESDIISCINRRKKGFVVLFDYDNDIILEGDEAVIFVQERPILNRQVIGIKQLTGSVGYKGVATGTVCIVKTAHDNPKVKYGDVVVSIMTTPNFIPALEKASAFITDEGGITCHAAIIAREMKKPCIIGTKIATKVLKDGDMVEVDAEKGIVRKI